MSRRGVRVVEGASLESWYTVHTVSRVRIPLSPPIYKCIWNRVTVHTLRYGRVRIPLSPPIHDAQVNWEQSNGSHPLNGRVRIPLSPPIQKANVEQQSYGSHPRNGRVRIPLSPPIHIIKTPANRRGFLFKHCV